MKITNEEIAYHEAGHALVAITFNLPIKEIAIKTRKKSLGHTSYGDPFADPSKASKEEKLNYMINKITASWAGYIAQSKFNSLADRFFASHDEKKANQLIEHMELGTELEKQLRTRTFLEAGILINNKKNWKIIESLVKELVTRKKLNLQEMQEIIKKVN